MFVEFKTSNGNDTFVLNAFQIVSIHETISGTANLITIHDEMFMTSEKYKDVVEKLSVL